MLDKLIIIGAGGYAREILAWIDDINKVKMTWDVQGFIDDNPDALKGKKSRVPILGTIKDWKVNSGEKYVLGIANPLIKEKISKDFESRGAEFISVIHPTVKIEESAQYGKGIVLYPGSSLGPDVVVGDFVTILSTGLGHDAMVGNYSTISSFCGINGNVKLGERVFVGSHVCIAPSRRIGDDAFLCMGSVVMTNVKKGTKVIGNPARKADF